MAMIKNSGRCKNTFKNYNIILYTYSVLCCLHYMTLCGSTLGSGSGEAQRVSLGNLSRITESSTPVNVFACFHQHWTKLLKLLGTIGNGIIQHIPNSLPVSVHTPSSSMMAVSDDQARTTQCWLVLLFWLIVPTVDQVIVMMILMMMMIIVIMIMIMSR